MTTNRCLLIGPLLVAAIIGTVSVSLASTNKDWHGTKAHVWRGDSESVLRLWERGPDVVLTNEVAGVITDQTRCEGGVLTNFDVENNVAVVHADMSSADCTRIAASQLRDAGRIAKSGDFKAIGSNVAGQQKRTTYAADDPTLPVIVLDDASLPVSITFGGQVTTYSYEQMDTPAPPKVALNGATSSAPTYIEEYRTAAATDMASAFKVKTLPKQIGGFLLAKSFTYDSGPATGRAYYSIWQASLGRQVQVVLNTHVPTGGVPYAFTDDSGQMSFQMSDGDTCLQIFAPDLQSLRAAAAAIRPGLTAELEQSINHPSTPQMEPAPTK